MNDSSKVIDIVARIYESVAYDDVWQEVLTEIGEMIAADNGNLLIIDRHTQQLSMVSTQLSEPAIDHYIEEFAPTDERLNTLDLAPVGSIRKGSELIDSSELRASRLYSDFLGKYGYFHSIHACFYRDSQFSASIHFDKAEDGADFDNQTKKLMGVFIPHLTRAFTISIQTRLSQLQQQVQGQIRRTTDTALFLSIDRNMTRPMNEKAQQLLEAGTVVSLSNERFLLKNQTANKRLQQLVKQCILTAQGHDIFPGGFIRLESADPIANEWHIGVTPYRSATQGDMLWKAKGALIIVRAVERDSFIKLYAILSDFYGLTAAESEVLIKMISGLSSTQIAEELQLSKECVRSRLKKIYQKTGVSNQVQLTHNILEGPYRLANMLG